MSGLTDCLREIAETARSQPDAAGVQAIGERLLALADEFDGAQEDAEAAIEDAERKADEAREAMHEAVAEAEEAEERADAAHQDADDRLTDIEKILEAAVAAREGIPGAAAGTVRHILDLQPDLAAEIGRLTMFARIRPADYWSH